MTNSGHSPRIFLALDFYDFMQIKKWADFAADHQIGIKVGFESFFSYGPPLVKQFVEEGHSVFLDLKLYDIPTTVLKALDQIDRLKVDYVTVHSLCANEVWEKLGQKKVAVLAVTALTSMDDEGLKQIGIGTGVNSFIEFQVRRLQKMGQKSFVCSVQDRTLIKGIEKNARFMCPGLRLDTNTHDQKRAATLQDLNSFPETNYVVGRALTESKDPVETLKIIQQALRP